MKTFLFPYVLLAGVCLPSPAVEALDVAPGNDATDVALIKQLSIDMGDAMIAGDAAALDKMFADDWVAVGSGKLVNKQVMLSDFKSGGDKLEAYELGPIDVQVYGRVAVAHGGVTEKRLRDGKDTSGTFVWMDLLEKRDGRWQVVKSAGDKVK